MRYTSDKDIDRIISDLVGHGATVRRTGSGHVLVTLGRRTTTIPCTPSDPRTIHNVRAIARRMKGFACRT